MAKMASRICFALVFGCFARAWFHGGWWYAASLASAIAWCWVNLFFRERYDLVPAATGAMMNLMAILANHGRMPVLNAPPDSMTASHTYLGATTHLAFLCDWIPIGNWAALSAGDLVIIIGWPLAGLALWGYRMLRATQDQANSLSDSPAVNV